MTTTTFTSILIEQSVTHTGNKRSDISFAILSQLINVNLGKIIESEETHITIEFPYPVYRNAFTHQAMLNRISFYLDGDHYLVIPLC